MIRKFIKIKKEVQKIRFIERGYQYYQIERSRVYRYWLCLDIRKEELMEFVDGMIKFIKM